MAREINLNTIIITLKEALLARIEKEAIGVVSGFVILLLFYFIVLLIIPAMAFPCISEHEVGNAVFQVESCSVFKLAPNLRLNKVHYRQFCSFYPLETPSSVF